VAGADLSLVQAYENAVRSGAPDRDYLAQMVAASSGMNINVGSITAAAPDQLPAENSISGWKGFLDGVGSTLGGGFNPFKKPLEGLGNAADKVGDVVDATGDAIDFITDIPRVVTTLLGLVLIIAGIFALAKGPAVSIATGAVKNSLTS
jgi:hypothetical protein